MRILMGKGRAPGPAAAGPCAALPASCAALRPGPTGGGERSGGGSSALPSGAARSAGGGEGGDGAGGGGPFLGTALPPRPGSGEPGGGGGGRAVPASGRPCGGSGRGGGTAVRRRRSGPAGSARRASGGRFVRPRCASCARPGARGAFRGARLGSAGCPRPDGSAAWRLFPSAAQQIKRWQPKIPTGRSRFKRSRAAPPRSALPPPLLFSFSALPACVCPQLRGPAPRRVPRPLCWAGAAPRAGSWLNLLGSGQPCASARSPALLMTLNGARSAGEPGCSGRWCLRTALRAHNARHSKTACKGFGFLTGT